jgi:hypothetical protein
MFDANQFDSSGAQGKVLIAPDVRQTRSRLRAAAASQGAIARRRHRGGGDNRRNGFPAAGQRA